MSAYLFDIDGTTLLGGRALPGATRLFARLRAEGTPFLWVTNNTSRSRASWLARLNAAGLEPQRHELYTAGDASIDWITSRTPVPRVHLLGTEGLAGDFRAAGIPLVDDAPELLVLGYDTTLTYAKVARFAQHLLAGVPYVATHPDLTCPTPDGPIPDVGSFMTMFETATGRRPEEILGKPNATMIAGAAGRLEVEIPDIVMVGDRLETDIRMANDAGAGSCLVLTGVTDRAMLDASRVVPSRVIASIGELL